MNLSVKCEGVCVSASTFTGACDTSAISRRSGSTAQLPLPETLPAPAPVPTTLPSALLPALLPAVPFEPAEPTLGPAASPPADAAAAAAMLVRPSVCASKGALRTAARTASSVVAGASANACSAAVLLKPYRHPPYLQAQQDVTAGPGCQAFTRLFTCYYFQAFLAVWALVHCTL
jgi:hypothetical protein